MPIRKLLTIEEINAVKPEWSRLTAVKILPDVGYQRWVECLCNCGKRLNLRLHHLTTGKTRSCGCYLSDVMKTIFCKYVGSNKYIYSCYKGMMERCYKEQSKSFKNYGALGVLVCVEWVDDYQVFLDWALSHGWERSLQLDKDIKYVEKFPDAKRGMLYSPEYCQFVTCKENRKTTSRSVFIEFNGEKIPVMEFCETYKINRDTLSCRLKAGYSLDEAIANPFIKRSKVGVETKATKRYLYKGEIRTVDEIAAMTGLPRSKVYRTYYNGKTLD